VPESRLFADRALLPGGWARDVLFEITAEGELIAVTPNARPGDAARAGGTVLPGMPNLHSHAFQRAMAGLAERAGPEGDSFWTWREVMYGFVARMEPEDLEAVAAQLYMEMLKAGFTCVGEFQYLHHGADGEPYARPAEMSLRTVAAAQACGIRMVTLPTLYGFGGFGGASTSARQGRFLNRADRFMDIVAALAGHARTSPELTVGISPHSLRAVTAELLQDVLKSLDALVPGAPVHIHIAEQTKEVDDCLAWSRERPVDFLMNRFNVNGRWCLVHATHMTPQETARVARSGAVVGLCPTTEANLGDGIFPAPDLLSQGGMIAIGSDSHISVSPVEDLRILEYGQRLVHRSRNVLAMAPGASTGRALLDQVLAGGAQAMGEPLGAIAPGHRADMIVLDDEAPLLHGRRDDALVDSWIFSGNAPLVRDTIVGGRHLVANGRHRDEEAITARVRDTITRLTQGT
jgi:formimidoylglutamate deiminase